MRHVILLTATALVVSACMESPTQPAEAPSFGIASGQDLPFRGGWVSQPGDASGIACAAGQFPGRSLLEGNATHMGKMTGDAWACVGYTGPLSLQSYSSGVTLTAANGDEVWLEMDPGDPALWEAAITEDGLVITSAGGFFVVGGTGRFEGATGHVRLTSRKVGAADTQGMMDGTIS